MKTVITYEGVQLKLVEVLVDLELDDITIKSGEKLYFGDNPFNGAQIFVNVDKNGTIYEVADIIIEDDEADIIKYL